MIKQIITASFTMLTALTISAQTSKAPIKKPVKAVATTAVKNAPAIAGSTYLKYEINGTSVSLKKSELLSYTKNETGTEEGDNHSLVNLFVTSSNKVLYKMSIMFYTPLNKKPEPGKLPLGSILSYRDALPSAHVKFDKMEGDKFTFYGTKEEAEGLVEITKVEGDWIEGIFELDVPESYNDDGAPLKITNGSFRFKMEKAD